MRWRSNEKPKATIGDMRRREKFLWWPLAIRGEVRWLERASWYEKAVFFNKDKGGYQPIIATKPTEHYMWKPFRWGNT